MVKRHWVMWIAAALVIVSPARAGHDSIQVDPALKRHAGQVMALGEPDANGHVYSFRLKRLPEAPAFAADELRGWRLTMLAGKRFAQAFEVVGNGATEVTVSAKGEPLDGVAVKDVFVIENTPLLPSADGSQQ
jgi:hypothetical protein